MRGLVIFSVVFSGLISLNFGIPYKDFQINVIKSTGQVGKFETELKQAMTTTKNFWARDDVAAGTTALTIVLGELIGPAAIALPIIQKALSSESDWIDPMIKAITSQSKRALVESKLDEIENDSKLIADSINQLGASLKKNPSQKSQTENTKDIANVALVQDKLKTIISRFSSGNSIFREFPELATAPLLGLSALVSLFTPIRDAIYKSKTDETIVACQLSETLNEYFPMVLHWRLKNIHSISKKPVEDYVIYSIAYNPEVYMPGGGGLYYTYENKMDVRCDRNACNGGSSIICLVDELQDQTLYSGTDPSWNCQIDYLFLVRSVVKGLFDTAIGLSDSLCSDAMRGRHREPTGKRFIFYV